MKKRIVLTLAVIIFSFAVLGVCAAPSRAAPSTLTIVHRLGATEVPYDAKKLAVLDLAALDILDALGLGDRVVALPKASSVSYLASYVKDENVVNVGSLKEVDMESLNALEPDLIFIGGRLASEYENISKIAPTVCFSIDNAGGYMNSFHENVKKFASIFGMERRAEALIEGFNTRLAATAKKASGKTAIVGIVTSSSLSTLGNGSRCSIICAEAGFENLAADVNSTHGNSASFELLLEKNPDYIFILDRDTAINAKGAKTAKEVMENEIVMKTSAYQNGTIVYLTPDVWYLAEGGITATDVMIRDLE
jgi:iron complex transport system substrate-binding protein